MPVNDINWYPKKNCWIREVNRLFDAEKGYRVRYLLSCGHEDTLIGAAARLSRLRPNDVYRCPHCPKRG